MTIGVCPKFQEKREKGKMGSSKTGKGNNDEPGEAGSRTKRIFGGGGQNV
jgi:hypothetical protein